MLSWDLFFLRKRLGLCKVGKLLKITNTICFEHGINGYFEMFAFGYYAT